MYLTREEDNDLSARTSERKRSDLYNRAKYINTIKPNMYISIHLNATTSSSWKGLQVFYNKNNEENKVIAETITNNLKNNINNIREVKEENKYYMYKYIKYPGVLIEAGFISNPDENYLLRQEEYQNKLIILIADAIEKYYQKSQKYFSKNQKKYILIIGDGMQKIYLIYDEYNPPVECDYGFIKEMIYLGFLYPLKKRNYKMFYIMLLTEVAVSSLIMAFIPFKVGIITCILMLLLTNILFAGNYNMIVIEELLKEGYIPMDHNSSELLIKKGIYFKLQ